MILTFFYALAKIAGSLESKAFGLCTRSGVGRALSRRKERIKPEAVSAVFGSLVSIFEIKITVK
jgi:hypothetical protein